MSVLNITGLKKILGSQEIFRGADLRVEREEKVGLVGRNGEGKTTLLRLIEGEEHLDAGTITLSKGTRLGYVVQRPDFPAGMTVRQWVEKGLDEVHRLEAELERVGNRMGEADGEELDALMHLHGQLTERMEHIGGWEAERRVETVLSGIGLPTSLWDREANTLSGGEKSRTALARELVSVPDLLLLDEPTNHLDLAGIEWLESYLNEMKSAVLLVSHDRRLLDRVVDTIVEVERGMLHRYPGAYSAYVRRKEERYHEEYRAWEQQTQEIRREENFIKKHMGSQRTAEAKGRRKKLSHIVRLERPYNDVRRPIIKMGAVERGGEQVLEATGLSVGYGEKVLISDATVRIGRGERIGIVGPNGSGKTTLLRVLAGRAAPLAGELRAGYRAQCGYYDQEIADLREDGTPFTEIRRDQPQLTDLEIRNHLARFLFRGSDIDLPVSGLSGGERARLALARLVLSKPSWLALDEPTNHLDLPARTALEEMLSEFPGALVCVSHDRAFLDALSTTILEVKAGEVRTFRGNYSEYRAAILAEEEERAAKASKAQKASRPTAPKAKASPTPNGKTDRGAGSKGKRRGKDRDAARAARKVAKLEEEIIALEEKRGALLERLADEAVYRDPDAAREAQYELAELERDLEDKNREWERFAG